MSKKSSKKRARVEEGEEGRSEIDTDLRLSEELRVLVGGRKYVNQEDLSVDVLLRFLIEKGDIVRVKLFKVNVHGMGGSEFDVTMEEGQSEVSHLKRLIQDKKGTAAFSQHLFVSSKSSKEVKACDTPLSDGELIDGDCSVVLCIGADPGEFELSSFLIVV